MNLKEFQPFILGLLMAFGLPAVSMARDISGAVVFAKDDKGQLVNTGLKPNDFTSTCLDHSGTTSWQQPSSSESLFNCTLETEGDGNKGSPTVVTFTYRFSQISGSKIRLERITTDQGYTLSVAETYNVIRQTRKTAPRGPTEAVAGDGRLKTFTCSGELWNIRTDPAGPTWLEIGHGIQQCSIRDASSENAKRILSVCNLNADCSLKAEVDTQRLRKSAAEGECDDMCIFEGDKIVWVKKEKAQ